MKSNISDEEESNKLSHYFYDLAKDSTKNLKNDNTISLTVVTNRCLLLRQEDKLKEAIEISEARLMSINNEKSDINNIATKHL